MCQDTFCQCSVRLPLCVCQDDFCQCSVRTVTVCVRIHSVNVLLGLPLCVSGYILSMFC